MTRVAVLMSTYNGEKYLREQIDTILNQKGDFELKLFVRDDGSKDNTIDILEEYKNRYGIEWYQGENCGSAKSFMELVHRIEGYDFYAFADQDDFWLDNKIANGIEKISNTEPELYCGNGMVVDEKLSYLGNNVYKKAPSIDFYTVSCAGGLLGCTMIFNEKLSEIIRAHNMPEYMVMHDFYIALICMGVGGTVYYDKNPYIKYRQHGSNVVGVSRGVFGKVKDRLNSIIKKPKISIQEQAIDIVDRYEDIFLRQNIKFLKVVSLYKKNMWTRLRLAMSRKTKYVNWNKSITIRLAILLANR